MLTDCDPPDDSDDWECEPCPPAQSTGSGIGREAAMIAFGAIMSAAAPTIIRGIRKHGAAFVAWLKRELSTEPPPKPRRKRPAKR